MSRRLALVFAICAGLTACGTVPPAPAETFYRLQAQVVPGITAAPAIGRFAADSIYAERPLVYGDAGEPRASRQYHYHLWLYPPAQLVREHLAASLGSSQQDFAEQRIEGRVLRFDRLGKGAAASASVTLELRLVRGREAVFSRRYAAEENAGADGLGAHVQATERALATIYARFLADLKQAGLL